MSSPQTENGYTDTTIANELLESFYQSDFNGSEFRVLLFVIRSTYGYRKKAHAMSYQFIANGTGLTRRSVIRTVKQLVCKKALVVTNLSLVTEHSSAKANPNTISLNKNYLQWKTGKAVSDQSLVSENVTDGDQSGQTVVSNRSPNKEKLKKKKKKQKGNKELLEKGRVNSRANRPVKKPAKPNANNYCVLPDWMIHEIHGLWYDFRLHRREIIKPLTPQTEKKLIAELERLKVLGYPPDQVIDQSIRNGWAGLFELKNNYSNTTVSLGDFPSDQRIQY